MEKLRKLLGSFLIFELGGNAVWPVIVTGVGILIGWLQEYDVFVLYNATIFLGVLSIFGLERLSHWKNVNRAEHKLAFSGVKINLASDPVSRKIVQIALGVQLKNNAMFPITFEVTSLKTKIIDRRTGIEYFPPKKEYRNKGSDIPSGSIKFYNDHYIDLRALNEANMEVEIEAEVSYYRFERNKYSLKIKKQTFFDIGPSGIRGGKDWYDLE